MPPVLECVVNVSEGSDESIIDALSAACGSGLLDIHSDPHHNRSVFTLAGEHVVEPAKRLASKAFELLDIRSHTGVHPRIGVVDVVPFVPLTNASSDFMAAVEARDEFARWLAEAHGVPAFLYGPERTLPEIRRQAFSLLEPDYGPLEPHETAGASAVGVRELLIAYNLWLDDVEFEAAQRLAREIRRPGLRTLALRVGDHVQVSCNLTEIEHLGPAMAYDLVASELPVERAELVGLIPKFVLLGTPADRWDQLDLDADRTIEARLEVADLDRWQT